tara:strand:- start:14037 stop:16070 length:2034 start_codon:yes stop_codon:yes gene_type:complete
MAYYFLFSEKDTTIYSHPDRTQLNAGIDEILELVKEKGVDDQRYYPSRVLIKFKNEEIKDVIDNIIGSSTFNNGITQTNLQLFSTEHKTLTSTLNLETFAVSESWDEGTGRFTNIPIKSNGTSWIYRDNDIAKNQWHTGSFVDVVGLTFGSSSININEFPSASSHQISINGVDFIPVISSSIFNTPTENYVAIGTTVDTFGENLKNIINLSSSITQVTADYITGSFMSSGSASGSIKLNELPSGSVMELTINGVDFIPVHSASLFDNNDKEVFVEISGSFPTASSQGHTDLDVFGLNLMKALNASSPLTSISASFVTSSGTGVIPHLTSSSTLILTANEAGQDGNVIITTSSVAGNTQPVFTSSLAAGFSLQGGTNVISTILNGNTLRLTGLTKGKNVTVTTSSITGNTQPIFTSSVSNFSVQGGTQTSITHEFNTDTSGSIDAFGITKGGGTWYAASAFKGTQQFLQGDDLDVNLNVTSIVQKHSASLFVSQTYPKGVFNNGFIIKQPDSIEESISSSFGELKYFSTDSHTIYPPRLCFKWDDSIHNFNSQAKQSGELSVSLYRNKEEYNQNDEATFRIHVREKYPIRQFASSSNYLNVGYFKNTSYYSIRDAHTEQEIIPFDTTFTKLSADNEGMYFKIFMKGLQPERYYRILFKHINNDGTIIYDDNYNFKVIR